MIASSQSLVVDIIKVLVYRALCSSSFFDELVNRHFEAFIVVDLQRRVGGFKIVNGSSLCWFIIGHEIFFLRQNLKGFRR